MRRTGIRKNKQPQVIAIPRPDVTTAQVVLLALARKGRLGFRDLVTASENQGIGQRTENSFYTALARLKRRRQIIRTVDHRYELTQAGEYAALKAFVRTELVSLERQSSASCDQPAYCAGKPVRVAGRLTTSRWDGKWRIVIFDIPESKRPIRDYLRGVLKRLGCREFQRSMWIYPHRLPVFVSKLLEDPHIRKYARLITASGIDYDDDLRRKFKMQ